MRTLLCPFAALLLLGPLACVSGGKLRADEDVIRSEIARAKKQNAYRCAPRELALAEANVDFADGELTEGNSVRAQDHVRVAEDNARKALALSRDCGPKQVLIKQEPKKPTVVVQVMDRDGDGVPDPDDKCPDVPGPKENAGCPISKDTDGDGIPDEIDRCPTQPEDKDGFQDEDGCPEADNDNDGIVDAIDRCPNNPGPLATMGCPDRDGDGVADIDDLCPDVPGVKENHGCPGDRDGDGVADNVDKCPDQPGPKENDGCPVHVYKLVVVKKDKIEIKQQVHFATNKARIMRDSFDLLNQVVQVFNDFPDIKKVRVEGHTDSVGNGSHNMRLSQQRADAVKAYMVSHGVDPVRLESVGYGMTRPIASNATARGRAENRRVEFNIEERGP